MQKEKRVLYAGFDASQYSNGQFQHSNNHLNEICAGVFSTLREDRDYQPFSHQRDVALLDLLNSNQRHSLSLTLDRSPDQDFSDNLVYSAPRLLNYFLESMPLYKFDRVELHFDGRLGGQEKEFLREELTGFAPELVIKNYVKHFSQNKHPPSRKIVGKRNSKYAKQPIVVGLADILSNTLFKRHSLGLLLHFGDNTQSKLSIPTGEKKFITHTHIW